MKQMAQVETDAIGVQNDATLHKYIRIVSSFCDLAETFNARIDALMKSIDPEQFNQIVDQLPLPAHKLQIKKWLHADLSAYEQGTAFRGQITSIPDLELTICYVRDTAK